MRISELQAKDIISMVDGRRLGRIIDIEIDEIGQIKYFVVEQRRLFRFFSPKEEINITMQQIKKIGSDVILVEI